MSTRAQSWATRLPIKPSGKKFVLMVLANYVTDKGKTYPSMETIRSETSLGDVSIKNFLEALCADKIISDTGQRVGEEKDTIVFQLNPVKETEIKPKARRKLKDETSEEAMQIYEIYPRRVNKRKSLTYIVRGIKQYGFEIVMNGTKLFAEAWKASGKEIGYCPHDTTFFNNDRYTNDPAAWGLISVKKISSGPTYKEVLESVKEKETDVTNVGVWATSFYSHWKKLNWQRDGKSIDWKVELSVQIQKWRIEPK